MPAEVSQDVSCEKFESDSLSTTSSTKHVHQKMPSFENLNAVSCCSEQNATENDRTDSYSMVELHTADNQMQQENNGKMTRSRRKFKCECVHVLSVMCVMNIILITVLFTKYMADSRRVDGYGQTMPGGCRQCKNGKTLARQEGDHNSELDVNEVMTTHLKGTQDPARCCPDARESYHTGDGSRSETTFSTTTETIQTFVGMHVGLNHPLTDGRLEWSPPACADHASSYKTETMHLSEDKTNIIIPQSGKYRITSQLVFETVDKPFVLTHYISYRASVSSTHSILAKTMQTVGSVDPSNSEKSMFTPSSVTGTFVLKKGSMVGVYVSKKSIPYLFTDREVNSFGIELLS